MRPTALALASAALLVLLPAGATSAATNSCGRVHGGFETSIRANINCTAARRLVRRWHRQAVDQGRGPGSMSVGSYSCHSRGTDPEHVKVRCTYGSHVVRFFAGP